MDAVVHVRRVKDVGTAPARLLEVEDHEINIIVIVELTKHVARELKMDLDISVARTAREAASRWRDERPDVVLLDLHLPDGRGDEVWRQMTEAAARQDKPYVVCVTASGEDWSNEGLKGAGIDHWLAKPVRSEALLESLRSWNETRAAASCGECQGAWALFKAWSGHSARASPGSAEASRRPARSPSRPLGTTPGACATEVKGGLGPRFGPSRRPRSATMRGEGRSPRGAHEKAPAD